MPCKIESQVTTAFSEQGLNNIYNLSLAYFLSYNTRTISITSILVRFILTRSYLTTLTPNFFLKGERLIIICKPHLYMYILREGNNLKMQSCLSGRGVRGSLAFGWCESDVLVVWYGGLIPCALLHHCHNIVCLASS